MGSVGKRKLKDAGLTFSGVVGWIREAGSRFKDSRRGKNRQYTMEDIVLSAFSLFYLQCPSFLQYQRMMESDQGNNNARTLFGIDKIPSDNHIRTLLDEETPERLFPVFKQIFDGLLKTGLLGEMRSSQGDLLLAFDGVEYHSSTQISCENCKTRQHKMGEVTYSHGMVTAVLVKPGCPHVINLPPEFVISQDGCDKQDCENAAAKRWLIRHAADYQPYAVTALGDDLYSRQPLCEAVQAAGFHFIFTCKMDSHPTLYGFIQGSEKLSWIQSHEVERWTGKRHEIDRYRYAHDVPLRDGEDALLVNWFEITSTDDRGKVLYHNTFITDHLVTKENVASLVENGRARWKTENENNQTLKRHGYHLEHNFGHGNKHLCNIFATLNILAFLLHSLLDMTCESYQKIRLKVGARKGLFEHFRALTHYMLFKNWDKMLVFMMTRLKIVLDTS